MDGKCTIKWNGYFLYRFKCKQHLISDIFVQFKEKVDNCESGRREKPFNHWEPIYIGTNQVLNSPKNCTFNIAKVMTDADNGGSIIN